MKAIYKQLIDKSISAAIAAIEVYNKPDFKYREESFVILLVNAWELLVKAKILKDGKNRLSALYVRNGRRYKKSRTGIPLTVELLWAMKKVNCPLEVTDNLEALVEIRDTAVHFFHDDDLRYVVYTLGVAALRNYQTLCKSWFSRSLASYNFYIMPIGFSYNFRTLKMLEVQRTVPVITNLIKSVTEAQERAEKGDGTFFFACEIATELKSAKKFATGGDLTVRIDQNAKEGAVVITQTKKKLDVYPLSYTELVQNVKRQVPGVKTGAIDGIIKSHKVKSNPDLAAYSFRTKMQEDAFVKGGKLPKGITSIYKEEAVRFIVQRLQTTNHA